MSFSPLIRSALPEDDAFLRLLFSATNTSLLPLPQPVRHQLADMQYRARTLGYAAQFPNLQTLVISTRDDTPVGALLFAASAGTLRIVDIAVLPAHQGQGFGTAAIKHVLRLAESRKVCLRVQRGNPAERLYNRLGFHTASDEGMDLELSNKSGCHKSGAVLRAPESRPGPFRMNTLGPKVWGRGVAGFALAILASAAIPSFAQGILTVTPGRVLSTSAGTGAVGYTGDNGPATAATLAAPSAVAYDSSGNIYLADSLNHVVREIAASSGTITTIAGTGIAGFGGDNGPATAAFLDTPTGIAVDGSGNVYIADSHNHRIRKVTSGTISTIAGTGTAGFSGDGSAATSAQLSLPSAVAVDSSGNLYIADRNNHRIRKITGTTISTIAGDGEELFAGDGGSAISAALDTPSGVAVDTAGNVYIADRNNQRIRMVNTSGIISTLAGSGAASFSGGFSGDGASATAASLAKPTGVSVDSAGNVYIADTDNQRIRQVGGGAIATIAGSGAQGFGGDTVSQINLNEPKAVGSDAAGNLSIADRLNQRLRGAAQPSIAFANQGVGVSSAPQPVTLSNTGTASLAVSSATFTGSYSVAAGSPCGPLPIMLAPGASCVENLSYTPLVTGSSAGSVVFGGSGVVPSTILLTGTAIKTATTVSLIESNSAPFAGQGVTFTATVNVAGTVPATGTITFMDGAAVVGSAPLVNGVAVLTTSTLPDGPHSITAIYAGDLNYTGNTSPALPLSVLDFNFSVTAGTYTLTVVPGQAAVFSFAIQPVGGPFSIPVVLSASGLPPGATASFNPQTITLGATATTFTMTIQTLVAALHHPQFLGGTTLALGLLLLPFSQGLRRRFRGPRLVTLCGGCVLTLAAIGGLSGCGTQNGFLGQAQKSYTITVTGTATSPTGAVLQRSTTVTLAVE